MSPTDAERGIAPGSRGTGRTPVVSSGQRGLSLRAGHPAGYAGIVTAAQAYGKETADYMLARTLPPRRFIAMARAKSDFLLNHSDQLVADSPEKVALVQHMMASTLLMMLDEFERRLADLATLDTYLELAWQKGDPLAGLIQASDPFSYAEIWKDYLMDFKPRRRRKSHRKKAAPSPPVPTPQATIPEEDVPASRGEVDNLEKTEKQIEELLEPPTGFYDKLFGGLDGVALILELVGSAAAAYVSMATIYFGTAFTFGQTVQDQHKKAKLKGFVWAFKYFQSAVRKGKGKEAVRVSTKAAWNNIRKSIGYKNQLRGATPASPDSLKVRIQEGIIDSAELLNQMMRTAENKARESLRKYKGKVAQGKLKQAYLKRAHRLRMKFYDLVWKELSKKLPRGFHHSPYSGY